VRCTTSFEALGPDVLRRQKACSRCPDKARLPAQPHTSCGIRPGNGRIGGTPQPGGSFLALGSLMLSTDTDILKTAESWRLEGKGVAIATVVETWGSAPRPVGSHLVIDQDTNFLGSVSGGCVEGAVITEALDVIADGKPRMLEFGVADETAWQVGLSCGGRIKVYVERVD
jgi:hypothetical protein